MVTLLNSKSMSQCFVFAQLCKVLIHFYHHDMTAIFMTNVNIDLFRELYLLNMRLLQKAYKKHLLIFHALCTEKQNGFIDQILFQNINSGGQTILVISQSQQLLFPRRLKFVTEKRTDMVKKCSQMFIINLLF